MAAAARWIEALDPLYYMLDTEGLMATTMFFEETLTDHGDKSEPIDLEFGRSSFYGENLLYFLIDGRTVILPEKQGRRLCEAMAGVAGYLGYDK